MGGRLADDERLLLRHTLGLNRGGVVTRNYFFAGEGHTDFPTIVGLVARGLMVEFPNPHSTDRAFRATLVGRAALEEAEHGG